MKKILNIVLLLSSICFVNIQVGYAQPKTYSTRIAPISKSGYYNIELDNRIVGASKTDFSNLRIYATDSTTLTNTEIPYFIREVRPTAKQTSLIDYKLLNAVEHDSVNRFVVHNPNQKSLTDFYITINKADVSISATVKGSDNKTNWFIVKQKTQIYQSESSDSSEVTLFVHIPEGNYTYYEIELTNNQSSPLKVKKVNTTTDTKTYGQFSPTLLKISKSLLNRKTKTSTIVFAKQRLNYRLSKLVVRVNSPKDYYRHAVLKDSITKVSVPFVLSSKTPNEYLLNDLLVQNPYIEISNADNQPLEINSVGTFSLKRYATAYLENDKGYLISVSNVNSEMPDYDLQYFKEDIPAVLPIVETEHFYLDELVKISPDQREKANQNLKIILWGVLITVGLIVAFICYKAFKKLEK